MQVSDKESGERGRVMIGPLFGGVAEKGATVSPCGLYRYTLWRVWDKNLPLVVFCLLNPSTADAEQEDATTRRLMGFTRAWGCGGYSLVNLFAFRATDPAALRTAADPVGPDNHNAIFGAALDVRVRHVVAGWGVHGDYRGQDRAVLKLLRRTAAAVEALGLTKDGHPRHPLYCPAKATLIPLEG